MPPISRAPGLLRKPRLEEGDSFRAQSRPHPDRSLSAAVAGNGRKAMVIGYALSLSRTPFRMAGRRAEGSGDPGSVFTEGLAGDFPEYAREEDAARRLAARMRNTDPPETGPSLWVLCPEEGTEPWDAFPVPSASDPGRPILIALPRGHADTAWRAGLPREAALAVFGFPFPEPFYESRLVELDVPLGASAEALGTVLGFFRSSLGKSVWVRPPGSPMLLAPLSALAFCAAYLETAAQGLKPRDADACIRGKILAQGRGPFAFADRLGPAALLSDIRALPRPWLARNPEAGLIIAELESMLGSQGGGPDRPLPFLERKRLGTEVKTGSPFAQGERLCRNLIARLSGWIGELGWDTDPADLEYGFTEGLGWREAPVRMAAELGSRSGPGFPAIEDARRQSLGALHRIWANPGMTLWDARDGIAFLELHDDRSCLGASAIYGIKRALADGTERFSGILVGSWQRQFSLGADIAQVLFELANQEWENVAGAITAMQEAHQAIKYSPIPIVAHIQGLSLGGGCELAMHCAEVCAGAGVALGLPEARIGLIPAGGGLKELVSRAARSGTHRERLEKLRRYFVTAALGRLAHSPAASVESGLLDQGWALPDGPGLKPSRDLLIRLRKGFRPRARSKIPWGFGQEALEVLAGEMESWRRARIAIPARQWAAAERIAKVMTLEGAVGEREIEEERILELERKYALLGLRTRSAMEGISETIQGGRGHGRSG